jgi:hypothetical protein
LVAVTGGRCVMWRGRVVVAGRGGVQWLSTMGLAVSGGTTRCQGLAPLLQDVAAGFLLDVRFCGSDRAGSPEGTSDVLVFGFPGKINI